MQASYHFVYPDKIYTYNNNKSDFIEIMKTQFGIKMYKEDYHDSSTL